MNIRYVNGCSVLIGEEGKLEVFVKDQFSDNRIKLKIYWLYKAVEKFS